MVVRLPSFFSIHSQEMSVYRGMTFVGLLDSNINDEERVTGPSSIVSVSVATAFSKAGVAAIHVSSLPSPNEREKKKSLTKIFTFLDDCAVCSIDHHHSTFVGCRQSIGCHNRDKYASLRTWYSDRTVGEFSSDVLEDCLVLVSTLWLVVKADRFCVYSS